MVALSIQVNECGSLDAITPLPVDREVVSFSVAGQPCGGLIGKVKQPRIARLGAERDNPAVRNDAPITLGSSAQNVANFVGETKVFAIHRALARSRK
jgi:hypothetical protein